MQGGINEIIASAIESLHQLGVTILFTPSTDESESLKLFSDEIIKAIKYFGREKQALTRILTETGVELRERIEELSLVRRMGEILDITQDVNDLYNSILEIILDEIGAENASIMLYNKEEQVLELVVGKGKFCSKPRKELVRFKIGEGIAGQVVRNGEPILIDNTSLDNRFISLDQSCVEPVSLLSLPFPTVGEIIGVINVSHPSPAIFDKKHLRILSILANQIAITVNNVRLIEQLRISNQKLTVNEETLTIKVDELTQVNEAIERIRSLNENIIENVQNGIFLVGLKGEIIIWNHWLEAVTGVNRKAAIGNNVNDVFSKSCNLSLGKLIEKGFSRKRGFYKKQFNSTCSGCCKYWDFCVIPLGKAAKNQIAIVVVNDITSQVVADEERQHFIERLERLNKQLKELDQAKSEFVSMVSHELRTPLTVLKGYLSLFEERRYGEISPQQQEKLNIMAQKVFDLTDLIEELLDLSVIETGIIHLKRKEVDLKILLENCARDFVSLGSKVKLTINRCKTPIFIGDEERMKQVINNLIENAKKFSPSDAEIEIVLSQDESHFILQVLDQGLGVKDKDKKKVFGKFYQSERTSKQAQGAGLGLAIAKEIVERHKGEIWVEDNEPEGAIINVKLPLPQTSVKTRKKKVTKKTTKKTFNYSNKRVLVIEDDPGTIDLLEEILSRQKFTVTVASDGIEALDKGLAQRYDLILLDIMLPRLSGYQVCRLLREEETNKHTPIIIISAVSEQRVLSGFENEDLKIAAYVSKPFQHETFLEKIDQVLAKREAAGS